MTGITLPLCGLSVALVERDKSEHTSADQRNARRTEEGDGKIRILEHYAEPNRAQPDADVKGAHQGCERRAAIMLRGAINH